jgi:STE24 endopeptidase
MAVFGVALAAAAQSGGGSSAQPPQPPAPEGDKRFEVKVTPEMREHSRILDTLYFAGTGYSLVVLVVVLASGLSRRMRDAVRTRWRFLTAFLFFALFSVATEVLEFPLTYYGDFHVPHRFNLSDQSLASWFGDLGKALAVNIIIGGAIAALALLAIRKVRRWWIAVWLGSIPLMILGMVVFPIFIDPLFNKFEPLKDPVLRQALLDEASRAGIDGSRVFQVNKSKQTKTMNAYVAGIGPSNRIVLWDTTLQKMTRDEILAVMAHEMGHYVMKHIWKGLAFGVLVSLVICFLAQGIFESGIRRWGSAWGVEEFSDPAALPWLLLIVGVIGFILSPAVNGYSRHVEHQADVFGLELTHMNAPTASAFVKFAEDSKVDPTPNAFIEFWRYSHPSLAKRIHFILGYKPWEEGKANELWKGSKS